MTFSTKLIQFYPKKNLMTFYSVNCCTYQGSSKMSSATKKLKTLPPT